MDILVMKKKFRDQSYIKLKVKRLNKQFILYKD